MTPGWCRDAIPNYKAVHRSQVWCRDEVLRGVLVDIANELRELGALDEEECCIQQEKERLPTLMTRSASAVPGDSRSEGSEGASW